MRHASARGGGALLVAIAAALWGTDALFRRGLALELSAVEVVFWEHLALAAMALPFLISARVRLYRLTPREWLAVAVVGGGSSVAATILFTQAMRYSDPALPLLLQKFQPLIAVVCASLLLGERFRPRFGAYFVLALAGSYLVTFANPGVVTAQRVVPAMLALGAAALWALGTVLGRYLIARLAPADITGLRFCFGLPVAALLLVTLRADDGLVDATPADALPLALLALVPGFLALSLYYRGLARTPASVATLAELAFPLSALVVSKVAFDTALTRTQIIGAVVLAGTVTVLGTADRRDTGAGVLLEPDSRPLLEPTG
jgi:drug/metabolite transporter (DMT)-like permease